MDIFQDIIQEERTRLLLRMTWLEGELEIAHGELETLQRGCPHKWETIYLLDASGNNDSVDKCLTCGGEF